MTNEEAIRLVDDRMCYGRGKWSRHHQPVIDEYWQAGEMAIKALEAEPHWIPVTEKLPEYGTAVLTYNRDEEFEINHIIDDEDGEWFYNGAIAWMPLPEPFKGVTDGKV